jgi:endonuclease/exonuclease/phosphatase family metal-dependent hydrolase
MGKGRSFLRKILVILNVFMAASLLLSYGAAWISPDKAWIFAFFGLAYPVFLIINVIFVVFWLFLWKRTLFLSLVCIAAGWNSLLTLYPFRFTNPAPAAGPAIKIVSYNVHSLYGNQRDIFLPETKSRVTGFLAQQKADIICIQEFFAIGEDYSQTLMKFTKSIQLDYFYFRNYQEFMNKRKINAIATFSRYPIVNTGNFKLQDHSLFAIFSDIVVHGDTIRVYNLHLESIRFGDEDYSFYSHLTQPDQEKTPIEVGSKRMFWKLRKAFILRSAEVNILKSHIAACPYPVILAGDFNDTPSSYSYHQLSQRLTDSFKAAGNGFFESTYAGKFPSFRIDYVLYSKQFRALAYRKFDIELSDHFPISSTLEFHP